MGINVDSYFNHSLLPHLLINYNQISNIGLMNGKMGGVIFFMLYAQKTGIGAYYDYCDELLEDIYGQISIGTSIGFYDGLCGIGWGIEFLIKNNLTEGNTDELMEDIDKFVMERNPERMIERSFRSGLGGVLYYVTSRLKSFDRENNALPFDREYLSSLKTAVNRPFSEKDEIPDGLVDDFNAIMQQGVIDYNTPISLPEFMFQDLPNDLSDIHSIPLGIEKGLTGVALKRILP